MFVKITEDTHLFDISQSLRKLGLGKGDKVTLKFKKNKKRKLREVRITEIGYYYCDQCNNHYHVLTFSKGDKDFSFDDHLSGRWNVGKILIDLL